MNWIYLSPHFDDAAFSCGGSIWEQTQAGNVVELWTICAGEPSAGLSPFAASLHQRWQDGAESNVRRHAEDIAANKILGAVSCHFPIPDCIYRRGQKGNFIYDSEEALFGPLHRDEEPLVDMLASDLQRTSRLNTRPGKTNLVCPLTLGGHVDHKLTRAAVERWHAREGNFSLWYYADFPYVLANTGELDQLVELGWTPVLFPLSQQALEAWVQAMAAHSSQISTFWPGIDAMHAELQAFLIERGGFHLWKAPKFRS